MEACKEHCEALRGESCNNDACGNQTRRLLSSAPYGHTALQVRPAAPLPNGPMFQKHSPMAAAAQKLLPERPLPEGCFCTKATARRVEGGGKVGRLARGVWSVLTQSPVTPSLITYTTHMHTFKGSGAVTATACCRRAPPPGRKAAVHLGFCAAHLERWRALHKAGAPGGQCAARVTPRPLATSSPAHTAMIFSSPSQPSSLRNPAQPPADPSCASLRTHPNTPRQARVTSNNPFP